MIRSSAWRLGAGWLLQRAQPEGVQIVLMDRLGAADHFGPIIFDAEVPPGQRIGLSRGQEQAEIGDQRHGCAERGIRGDGNKIKLPFAEAQNARSSLDEYSPLIESLSNLYTKQSFGDPAGMRRAKLTLIGKDVAGGLKGDVFIKIVGEPST